MKQLLFDRQAGVHFVLQASISNSLQIPTLMSSRLPWRNLDFLRQILASTISIITLNHCQSQTIHALTLEDRYSR
jgi:hypothetical protein